MSKIIIAADIFILNRKIQKELPNNLITTLKQVNLIERFVKFVSLIYVKWWVKCPLAADSPINDLEFLSSIKSYSDNTISSAAEKAIKNHLWYLTEELVPLAIFSS